MFLRPVHHFPPLPMGEHSLTTLPGTLTGWVQPVSPSPVSPAYRLSYAELLSTLAAMAPNRAPPPSSGLLPYPGRHVSMFAFLLLKYITFPHS